MARRWCSRRSYCLMARKSLSLWPWMSTSSRVIVRLDYKLGSLTKATSRLTIATTLLKRPTSPGGSARYLRAARNPKTGGNLSATEARCRLQWSAQPLICKQSYRCIESSNRRNYPTPRSASRRSCSTRSSTTTGKIAIRTSSRT